MKSFKQFLLEQPTNNVGNGGYTNSASATGPMAGVDPVLFKGDQFLNSNLKYLECDKNNFLSFPRTVE